MKSKVCPKCEGEMKIGNFTGIKIDWEQEDQKSFLKEKGNRINTYACVKCGFMESYVNS